MNPTQDYHLIKPEDLHWRPSNLMRIPNANYLERTSARTCARGLAGLKRAPAAEDIERVWACAAKGEMIEVIESVAHRPTPHGFVNSASLSV